jgi:hypothetical protein
MAIRSFSNSSISTAEKRFKFLDTEGTTYTQLYYTELTSPVSSVSISIPSGYKTIQVLVSASATRADIVDFLQLKFNSDTTSSNYARHLWYSNLGSSSSTGFSAIGTGNTNLGPFPAANANANNYGPTFIEIVDYDNTSKWKIVRSITNYQDGTSGSNAEIGQNSILYKSTNAITTLDFNCFYGSNIDTGSSFSVYGIRG